MIQGMFRCHLGHERCGSSGAARRSGDGRRRQALGRGIMQAIVFLMVVAMTMVGWTWPALAESLPTPSGLQQDVEFWERVFRDYTPNHCVFHDRDDLGIIYLVKDYGAMPPSLQALRIRHDLEQIRSSMENLASGLANGRLERKIIDATPGRLRYPAYWRYAKENVRCQRGVDIGKSLRRSRNFVAMVKRVLDDHGLPTDLAYLPLLESGYDPRARSRAGARGLWQLMPSTARNYGLKVARFADSRLEPRLATKAAARLFQELYSKTNSWPLAITAYNYGINGMERAIKQYGNDFMTVRERHKTRVFGFASRNYYASFLAARNVAMRYDSGATPSAFAGPQSRQVPKL